jgi:sporulation protein YlmC with PRC-barrel domain
MTRLSQIEGLRVRDSDGRRLGRVWDLRTVPRDAAGADTSGRAVAALLVGRRGLLERLGFKREAPQRIACEDVIEVGADAVIVRPRVAPMPRGRPT